MEKINFIEILILTIWLMLPAYLANPAAAIAVYKDIAPTPIDLGKKIGNNRILGDGKTYKGLICGVLFGIILGFIQSQIAPTINLPVFSISAIIALPVGSLMGDIIASFFKRRINMERGASFPLIDQLDFVFGAWLLTFLIDSNWFLEHFSLPIIISTLILTPMFHLIFNIIGYKIGVSKHPW
ncbi:MAG: CDP-2,3-bis-(O-geranylgeranyl)-sn-glycerol synthase [Cyanobacteriota bacterium]